MNNIILLISNILLILLFYNEFYCFICKIYIGLTKFFNYLFFIKSNNMSKNICIYLDDIKTKLKFYFQIDSKVNRLYCNFIEIYKDSKKYVKTNITLEELNTLINLSSNNSFSYINSSKSYNTFEEMFNEFLKPVIKSYLRKTN